MQIFEYQLQNFNNMQQHVMLKISSQQLQMESFAMQVHRPLPRLKESAKLAKNQL